MAKKPKNIMFRTNRQSSSGDIKKFAAILTACVVGILAISIFAFSANTILTLKVRWAAMRKLKLSKQKHRLPKRKQKQAKPIFSGVRTVQMTVFVLRGLLILNYLKEG